MVDKQLYKINLLRRQILYTVLSRGISTALNFFIALLIARHSGPMVKGDVTLLITTLSFFLFISNIMGGQALVYLIPRNKIELLAIPAYVWSLIVSGLGFLLLKYTNLLQTSHVPSLAVLSLLSSFIQIHQTILMAKGKISTANLVSVATLLLQVSGVLVCFYFIGISDAYAYIYASLLAYLIAAVFSFVMVRQWIAISSFVQNLSGTGIWQSFRYGMLYQMAEILQLFNLRYYFYQLGIQQGPQYLGIFSIGISILEAVWIIPRSIATVHYVSTSNTEEVKRQVQHTIGLAQLSGVLCTVALVAIFLIPNQLYIWVFGQGFADVKHSVRFLYPGILIYSLLLVISSFYQGTGRYWPLIVANSIGSVVLLVASYLLIPPYVMSGAGLAASISFAAATATLTAIFVTEQKISPLVFLKPHFDLKKISLF